MRLLPICPQEARIFRLDNQPIFFINSSSDKRQAAENDGKIPQRESELKREEPS